MDGSRYVFPEVIVVYYYYGILWLRKLKTCKDVNIIYAVQDVGDQTPVSCICFFVRMVFCAANCLAVFPLWCCLLSGGFAFSVWRPDGSWNNHHLYALFWIRCTSKIVQVTPIRVKGLRWLSPQALISGGVSFEEGSYRIPHDKILAIEQWSESPWGLASCISPYLYNFLAII